MSEPTWTLDGSAVERTSPLGATWTVRKFEIDDAELDDPGDKQVQVLDAHVDQGTPHLSVARDWTLVVEADVSTLPGTDVTAKLYDGWAELATAFDPLIGVVKLQSARLDTSETTITRHLITRLLRGPSYTPRTSDPKQLDAPGAYAGDGGYIVYPVKGRTLFPYWIGSSLLTLDQSAATAELAIGASPDTVVIDNDGARWVGIKATAGSVSGSVTSLKIENGANGDRLAVTNAGGFANGDYLDFLATNPRRPLRSSSAVRFGDGYFLRLERGSNTLTGTLLEGTGSLVLGLSWPELHLTN